MSSDNQVTVEANNSWPFAIVLFVWMFFFMRGCGNRSSYFDEYMRAKYGHQVESVDYEQLTPSVGGGQ